MSSLAMPAKEGVRWGKLDTFALAAGLNQTSTTITLTSARHASSVWDRSQSANVFRRKCTVAIIPGCGCCTRRAATNVSEIHHNQLIV
jgi:hypothetical protein